MRPSIKVENIFTSPPAPNIGPTTGWLDLSSAGHNVTRSVYVMVLRKDLPSPLAPESDEEKGPDAKSDDSKKGRFEEG